MGSRYQYDVNKTTRYIDIHKQFQGGLKTVDTDDSLKDIFLREAENVSLSEFGFLEKRYGLHKNDEHKPWTSIEDNASKLQGYFEYYVDANTVHKIVVFEGQFYINQGAGFQQVLLFDSPTGEAIDLSSLGVYTNADIELSWASDATFGAKVPWYYVSSSPNGVVSGVSGDIIQGLNYFYMCSGGTSWTQVSAAPTFPFGTNLLQGSYYKDTRTNKIYQWENADGYDGKFTLVTGIYDADIQTTRPVDGIRIEDKLYIATGTYPVYYKGDGKIYVFEQYEMSDLDIQNLGYDLNNVNLEQAFSTPAFTETSSHGDTYDGESVTADTMIIKDSQISKRFPFVGETIPTEIKVALHLYNNSTLDRWGDTGSDATADVNLFDSTLTSSELATWLGNPSATQTNTVYGQVENTAYGPTFNNRRYRTALTSVVYIKPSGALPSLYEPFVSTDAVELTNDVASGSTNRLPRDIDTLNNLVFKLKELTAGYWDIKVEMFLTQTGFFYTYELPLEDATNQNSYAAVRTKVLDTKVVEFTNIWVTAEELVDYKEAPYTTLKVHTCNRIGEHFGRLVLWGNPSDPSKVFFSTAGAKNYFPYFYMIDFTNDLQEGVNAITKFQNILVVQSDSYTWGLKGSVPLLLDPLEGSQMEKITINPTIGCIAPNSVKNIRNQLFFLSKEGVFSLRTLFAEDLRYNVDPIDRNIYNIVPRDTDAICAYYDDQYWLHFPQSATTLRYYVEKKAWVKDVYSAWNIFGGIFKYINESGVLRFITNLSQFGEGDDYKIFDVDVDYALPTDLGENVSSKFTTSYLNQNYPFHPKNYKEAKFEFTLQNEYNTSREPILPILNSGVETSTYVQFDAPLLDRHQYSLTFDPSEVSAGASYSIYLDGAVSAIASGTISATGDNLNPITFVSNRTGDVTVKIEVTNTVADSEDLVLYDSTYDNSITFINAVLSEEGTLNIDPINSYDQAEVEKTINLGTRLGNWVFGTSDFGNVITAVQTIKLSGRGYNCKINVQEYGKSKWTLESVGITYKVKKARSR